VISNKLISMVIAKTCDSACYFEASLYNLSINVYEVNMKFNIEYETCEIITQTYLANFPAGIFRSSFRILGSTQVRDLN